MTAGMKARQAIQGTVQRCPACGQRLGPPSPTKCPLCSFDFGDDRVTGADITPYAKTYARGMPGWIGMCEWFWFAGAERLKHVALARASAASRRFARINVFVMTLAFGIALATHVGWRFVSSSPAAEPSGAIEPVGSGWVLVAQAATPPPLGTLPATLWWNPSQSAIALAATAASSVLLFWMVNTFSLLGVHMALAKPYRHEGRMSAAFHYSTSWGLLLAGAALITLLRPLAYMASLTGWALVPSDRGVLLAAGVVAGLGGALWWFSLVRMGALGPLRTRARLASGLAIVPPVLATGAVLAFWHGSLYALPIVFRALRIQF